MVDRGVDTYEHRNMNIHYTLIKFLLDLHCVCALYAAADDTRV